MTPSAMLVRLELFMDCADFDGLAQASQRMMARAVAYGLPDIARIGSALHVAAVGGDVLAMVTRIEELRDYLAQSDHQSPIAA